MITEDKIIDTFTELFWKYMPFVNKPLVEDAVRGLVQRIREFDKANAPKLTPTVTFTSSAKGVITANIDLEGKPYPLGTWHLVNNRGTFRIGPKGETPSEFHGGSVGYVNDFHSWFTLMQTFSRA
jgi:hypothetical protein